MHKVAKIVIVIAGIVSFSTNQLNAQEIIPEMRSFFIDALKDNYGEKSEKDLFYDFFEEYHTKKGNIELEINYEGLLNINKVLLQDSVYYRYYMRLVYTKNQNSEDWSLYNGWPSLVFTYWDTIYPSVHGLYVIGDYVTGVCGKSSNEVLVWVMEYYSYVGMINYLRLARRFMFNPECLDDDEVIDFLVVVLWKRLCDLAGADFYKIMVDERHF